jgi:hypothetical protein
MAPDRYCGRPHRPCHTGHGRSGEALSLDCDLRLHVRFFPEIRYQGELVFLIGGAFVASVLAKRFAGTFIKENPEAMTGVAVCAMFLAGMGSMKGMQAHLLAQPQNSLAFVAMAYLLLFGAEILGTLLFWRFGRTAALTAGLVSGTRTITLAWVVLGDRVLPLADLFLAAGMIAKYTAPGLTKWLLTRILTSGEVAAPAPLAAPQPASSEPAQ